MPTVIQEMIETGTILGSRSLIGRGFVRHRRARNRAAAETERAIRSNCIRVHLHIRGRGKFLVLRHLQPALPGQRAPQGCRKFACGLLVGSNAELN
jgi:hypothetical protein